MPADQRQIEKSIAIARRLDDAAGSAPRLVGARLYDRVEQVERKGEDLDHGPRHRRAGQTKLRMRERAPDGEGLGDLDELLAERLRLELEVHLALPEIDEADADHLSNLIRFSQI